MRHGKRFDLERPVGAEIIEAEHRTGLLEVVHKTPRGLAPVEVVRSGLR